MPDKTPPDSPYIGASMGASNSIQKLEFSVRSTILDRHRSLVIDPEYIEFDDRELAAAPPTRFLKAEIAGLRYGVKWIRGYQFAIGRIFCVDIRDTSGRIIKIRLKSIYRIRRKLLAEKYTAIVSALFRAYFHALILQYAEQLRDGKAVDLLGVNFNGEGVLFDEKVGRVKWEFLGTKRYWHYYTLYSEETPDDYRALVFLEDWNAGVLLGLVEFVLKTKFPNRTTG